MNRPATTLRITLAQINPVVGDLDGNARMMREAWQNAPPDSDLIVFPELGLCGYAPEDLALKPSFLDRLHDHIAQLTVFSKTQNAAALIPTPWRGGGHVCNAALLIERGQIIATIFKHHLPNYGVFDEKRIFKPGPMPEPILFRGHCLGFMICEDMWHEDIAFHLKSRGADAFIVTNASPFDPVNVQSRQEKAHARVRDHKIPLVYVNQVGGQDDVVFDGASFVLDAAGHKVFQAPSFTEDISTLDVFAKADAVKKNSSDEENVYSALVLGLRDYVRKNNFPGVLIGISGGIDSALVAAIAVDALGADFVSGVMMPSKYTARQSIDDSKDLAMKLGIKLQTIPIDPIVQQFEQTLRPFLPAQAPAVTFENLQSRVRGTILMALSNAGGEMVLSTGNKSELATGYATLYGDMCGGFNPLKDVYKTQVYKLCAWRNRHRPRIGLGPALHVIPQAILDRPPTAELRENQTDQDTLPPYEELDAILRCLIEEDLGVEEVVRLGHDRDTAQNVAGLLKRSEYKRYQAPPGPKITARAFGRERRMPITNGFK